MKIIETERVSIHALTLKEDAFIFRLMNSSTWLKYIGDRNIRTKEDARNYLQNGPIKSYEAYGVGMYGVKLKEAQEFIGICGLVKRDFLDNFDFGYAFLPEYAGKGLAFEASKAVLDYLAANRIINRVVAFTTENNGRSLKLLEKLEFQFEHPFDLHGEECLLFGRSL